MGDLKTRRSSESKSDRRPISAVSRLIALMTSLAMVLASCTSYRASLVRIDESIPPEAKSDTTAVRLGVGEEPVVGRVRVQLDVSESGEVSDLRVIDASDDELAEKALKVLKLQRFRAGKIGGKPAAFSQVEFELEFFEAGSSNEDFYARIHRVEKALRDPDGAVLTYPNPTDREIILDDEETGEFVEGWVRLRFDIERTGEIRNVMVVEASDDRLKEKAAESLTAWHFAPGTVNGDESDFEQLEFKMNFYTALSSEGTKAVNATAGLANVAAGAAAVLLVLVYISFSILGALPSGEIHVGR